MLPKPSLCLNLPKTGTNYTARFFAAADWLHLRHACRGRLRVPNRAALRTLNAFKRLGVRYGSLNPALPYHAGYSTLPAGLRTCLRLCALRDVEGWYCSQYLYYTRRLKRTLLARSIRFLVHGRETGLDPDLRAILLRRRSEFLERFAGERAGPDSIEHVPVPFLVWFNLAVRAPYKVRRLFGIDALPAGIGYLTLRTVVLLLEDPARVLSLPGEDFHDHFASGRYRRDLRADFYLRFHALTDDLCALMAAQLRYDPDILEFLRPRIGKRNESPADRKPPVVAALRAGGLIGRIRRSERIYERYLLPLAGARDDAPAGQSPPGGPRPDATGR